MNDQEFQKVAWASSPPAHTHGARHNLRRLRAGERTVGTIVGHDMVGVMLHWTGSKTQPCFGKTCRCAETNQEVKWRGYIWWQDDKLEDTEILEVTPCAGSSISAYFDDHRTLRGTRWSISRKGKKYNGMEQACVSKQLQDHRDMPTMPKLEKVLMRIWGLPEDEKIVAGGVIRDEIAKALALTNGQAK